MWAVFGGGRGVHHACHNTLTSTTGVPNLTACRQLCDRQSVCSYLTYFGPDNFPFSETCFHFSSCDSLHPCTNCTSVDVSCSQPSPYSCSDPVEGVLGENMLNFFPDVESEEACRNTCLSIPACNFYTYHGSCDPNYPGACALLSHVLEPVQECNHCRTGAVICSSRCSFLQGGEYFTSRGVCPWTGSV